jgi:subtilisin family serine protease
MALLLVACTRGNATPTASPPRAASPTAGGTPRTVVGPTGTERKVDAILLEILDTNQRQGQAAAEQLAREAGVLGDDNLIRLTLVLTDTNTQLVADKIVAGGGTVTGISGNIVEIEVPLDRWLSYLSSDGKNMMEDLAAFDTVVEVRVTPPFHPQGPVPTGGLRQALTAITTEGLKASGADRWQAAGFYGQGVKIGIIDVGFGGYEKLVGTELPPAERLQTRSFASNRSLGTEVHGTAVAEIVHDMVPDASLWLVRIDTNVSTENAVEWLVDEVGVDLISMSIGSAGYYRQDGSSISAQAVDYAFSKGVLCIIAAGNEADAHYGGAFSDEDGDGYHDFAPGKGDLKITPGGSQVQVVLNWEAWDGPPIDLNLEAYDANGRLLRASTNVQNTEGRSPVEYVTLTGRPNQPLFVRIKAESEPGAVPLNIFVQAGTPEIITPAGSIATPGDAKFGLSVAATRWDTGELEIYSSQGPTADGRIKPDIAGPTVVSTASYPNASQKFNGTSAATPHVSGAAALFLTANPEATAEQIVQFLWGRALDLDPTGQDPQTGYGRLQLGEPPATPPPSRAAPAASPSPAPSAVASGPPSATPAASPTVVPPTPTRPAVAGTPGISFNDPLAVPGTGLPQGGEVGYVEGQYRITPSGPNRAAWATFGGVYGDVRIEATAQFVGPTPGMAGIVFWFASPEDYYLFAVTSDGYYQLAHFHGGSWTALTLWQQDRAIVAGGPQRLRVETAGERIAVSVNGTQLANLVDPGGGSGSVGLLAATFDQPGAMASFSEVVVSAGP